MTTYQVVFYTDDPDVARDLTDMDVPNVDRVLMFQKLSKKLPGMFTLVADRVPSTLHFVGVNDIPTASIAPVRCLASLISCIARGMCEPQPRSCQATSPSSVRTVTATLMILACCLSVLMMTAQSRMIRRL